MRCLIFKYRIFLQLSQVSFAYDWMLQSAIWTQQMTSSQYCYNTNWNDKSANPLLQPYCWCVSESTKVSHNSQLSYCLWLNFPLQPSILTLFQRNITSNFTSHSFTQFALLSKKKEKVALYNYLYKWAVTKVI